VTRLLREDVEEALVKLWMRSLPEFLRGPAGELPKPTQRQRLAARIWGLRFRIANAIYPYPADDD
jgi:hypothetical protein